MAGTYTIRHHPLPVHDWAHGHKWLVRFSSGLVIALLAVAIAAQAVSMIRGAIAEQIQSFAKGAEAISTAALPREWRWTREPITFDHMYRQSEPRVVSDYIRDVHREYYSSSWE